MVLYDGHGERGFEDKILRWVENVLEASTAVGGNIVIEKAYYPLKENLPVWGLRRDYFDILLRIKREIDPKGIFSPGRFVAGI